MTDDFYLKLIDGFQLEKLEEITHAINCEHLPALQNPRPFLQFYVLTIDSIAFENVEYTAIYALNILIILY